ncbi:hypothetical protein [Novosphingobium sp.]|uniref:hypothetical protein n=1 Tax=Novosphingobium sp. TaxID=1874826 RepID=UPI001ECDA16B|nr:hypothetical protein [Novosphingobium sp.]MBK6802465.1 hypothetical protein [Novosphingobium sp.]MBK9009475.1 hypothetical protein [Novosphingobium sp.]
MVEFENRRGATLKVVSTGNAEGRQLQPGMEQFLTETTLVEPRGDGSRNTKTAEILAFPAMLQSRV